MKSVEELEQELYESEVSSEAMAESLAQNKASGLTGLTPRQYERVIGRKPPPGLLIKARDATTRKVQWDNVLDQLASEEVELYGDYSCSSMRLAGSNAPAGTPFL